MNFFSKKQKRRESKLEETSNEPKKRMRNLSFINRDVHIEPTILLRHPVRYTENKNEPRRKMKNLPFDTKFHQ